VGPSAHAFFDQLADAMGYPASIPVRALTHSFTREAALRVVARFDAGQAQVFRAMLHDTVTPTVLRAGNSPNVVPGEAEAIVDGRVLPGTRREEFLARVRAVVGPVVRVEMLSWGAPTEFPPDSPVVDAIRTATASLDPGAHVVPWLNVGFTDASQLARLGIQTYGYYPLRLRRDLRFAALFHGDDERVPVDGYRFGFGLFVDTVLTLAAPIG
jgi:acetylornithine deacetylase/succinyl-diaminopimelate desuccinylase-like protein